MSNKINYIIYHKNCLDGYCGFFLFNRLKLHDKNSIIYPDVPSTKIIPPKILNKNVIIIDVAYSIDILEKIFSLAKNVIFIDHHITTKNYSQELAKKYNQHVFFDEKYSGAGLVWKIFYKIKEPSFVKYIQDNDLGLWKHKNTKPFITYLQVKFNLDPENSSAFEKLFDKNELSKIIKYGNYFEEYKIFLLEQNSKRYSLEYFPSEKILNENIFLKDLINKVGKYKVAVFNGGCPNTSALGSYLMENNIDKYDFVWIWTLNLNKKEIVVSLRSKNNGVNVEQIAKCFGGGGHPGAAAFSVNIHKNNIFDFFIEKI